MGRKKKSESVESTETTEANKPSESVEQPDPVSDQPETKPDVKLDLDNPPGILKIASLPRKGKPPKQYSPKDIYTVNRAYYLRNKSKIVIVDDNGKPI